MVDSIQISTSAMLADVDRMRLISQNITNGSTPGYRAELSNLRAPSSFADLFDAQSSDNLSALRLTTQGALKQTQRSLDVAIQGDGYFEIDTDRGIRYTRRGDFGLDADSQLVTQAGDKVLGTGGAVRVPDDNFTINSQGVIRSADAEMGILAVAVFDDDAKLVYEGNGLYRSEAIPLGTSELKSTRIQQGALEMSNVQPMDQMALMMETVRHLSLSAQALRAYDQVLDAAINQAAQF